MFGVSKSSAAGLSQERLKVRDVSDASVESITARFELLYVRCSIQTLTDALQLSVHLHAA